MSRPPTLDPSRAEEIAALSRSFSREQIKLFFLLRSIMQFVQRTGGVSGAEQEANRVLAVHASTPGLSSPPRASSDYRDVYIVRVLVQEGQRVFAVVGGSHVLMQEQALRTRLR